MHSKGLRMNWEDKREVQKGNIGEQLVKDFLESLGFLVYKCISEKAHPIDFSAFKGMADSQKMEIVFVDAKAKARRTRWADTGIDKRHFDIYEAIGEKFQRPVWIFFIDETPCIESIYGNSLEKLKASKPNIYKGIVYFDLRAMIHVAKIPKDYAAELRGKSKPTRRYKYWEPRKKNKEDMEVLRILTGTPHLIQKGAA